MIFLFHLKHLIFLSFRPVRKILFFVEYTLCSVSSALFVLSSVLRLSLYIRVTCYNEKKTESDKQDGQIKDHCFVTIVSFDLRIYIEPWTKILHSKYILLVGVLTPKNSTQF